MEIVIEGTSEEVKDFFQRLTKETPIKQSLSIDGEEVSTSSGNEKSCNLKVTNLDELEKLGDEITELYKKIINFKFETEIVEDKRA